MSLMFSRHSNNNDHKVNVDVNFPSNGYGLNSGDGNRNSGSYIFSSQPRVVQRKKYKDKPSNKFFQNFSNFSNLFSRSESVKGKDASTMSAIPSLSAYSSFIESRKSKTANSKYGSAKFGSSLSNYEGNFNGSGSNFRNTLQKARVSYLDRHTPEPVEGRKHVELQTELYLEELGDNVEEVSQSCQTDPFINRPPSPMYVPAKVGIDKPTQIYEGDLFDFDIEVRPIVEVLIGKVVEQSMLEVVEEEELASLRERQRRFEEIRNAELQEEQRLEEEERRRKEEKVKRMKFHQELIKKEKETAEKIAAKAFAQSFLTDLVPSVIASLSESGYFHDPVEAELEKNFMEDLMRGVCKRLRYEVISRKLIDKVIRTTVREREKHYLENLGRYKNCDDSDYYCSDDNYDNEVGYNAGDFNDRNKNIKLSHDHLQQHDDSDTGEQIIKKTFRVDHNKDESEDEDN